MVRAFLPHGFKSAIPHNTNHAPQSEEDNGGGPPIQEQMNYNVTLEAMEFNNTAEVMVYNP